MPRETSIAAGSLNTRITIESETRTPDGQGGYTKTWATYASAWARKRFLAGGDTTEEDQIVSRRRFEYTIRRRSDVTFTSAMRIVDGATTLDIKSVYADDYDHTAQTLVAEEVP